MGRTESCEDEVTVVAIRWLDSVAHYSGSGINEKWTSSNNITYQGSGGRRNAPMLALTGGSVVKTLTHQARYIQGCAVQYLPGNGPCLTVLSNNQPLVQLLVNADSTVSAFAAPSGTRIATSTIAVADSTSWHFFEMDCTLSGGTSTITASGAIRVDGLTFVNFNGPIGLLGSQLIDGSATANQVGIVTNGTLRFHDYYCFDSSATDANGFSSTNTGFAGDVQVDCIFPNGDATPNQWAMTGGTSTNHWTTQNDNPPDFDTSYLSTTNTASNNVEKFTYQPISGFTGTILGVQYLTLARKDAEGPKQIALTVGTHTASTIEFAGTANYLSDFYTYLGAALDTDFGSPWGTASFGTGGETFGFACIG